jgi:hypothetical protein
VRGCLRALCHRRHIRLATLPPQARLAVPCAHGHAWHCPHVALRRVGLPPALAITSCLMQRCIDWSHATATQGQAAVVDLWVMAVWPTVLCTLAISLSPVAVRVVHRLTATSRQAMSAIPCSSAALVTDPALAIQPSEATSVQLILSSAPLCS